MYTAKTSLGRWITSSVSFDTVKLFLQEQMIEQGIRKAQIFHRGELIETVYHTTTDGKVFTSEPSKKNSESS